MKWARLRCWASKDQEYGDDSPLIYEEDAMDVDLPLLADDEYEPIAVAIDDSLAHASRVDWTVGSSTDAPQPSNLGVSSSLSSFTGGAAAGSERHKNKEITLETNPDPVHLLEPEIIIISSDAEISEDEGNESASESDPLFDYSEDNEQKEVGGFDIRRSETVYGSDGIPTTSINQQLLKGKEKDEILFREDYYSERTIDMITHRATTILESLGGVAMRQLQLTNGESTEQLDEIGIDTDEGGSGFGEQIEEEEEEYWDSPDEDEMNNILDQATKLQPEHSAASIAMRPQLEAKLEVGEVDDKEEAEAERGWDGFDGEFSRLLTEAINSPPYQPSAPTYMGQQPVVEVDVEVNEDEDTVGPEAEAEEDWDRLHETATDHFLTQAINLLPEQSSASTSIQPQPEVGVQVEVGGNEDTAETYMEGGVEEYWDDPDEDTMNSFLVQDIDLPPEQPPTSTTTHPQSEVEVEVAHEDEDKLETEVEEGAETDWDGPFETTMDHLLTQAITSQPEQSTALASVGPQPGDEVEVVDEDEDKVETEVEDGAATDWDGPYEDTMNNILSQAINLPPEQLPVSASMHLQPEVEVDVADEYEDKLETEVEEGVETDWDGPFETTMNHLLTQAIISQPERFTTPTVRRTMLRVEVEVMNRGGTGMETDWEGPYEDTMNNILTQAISLPPKQSTASTAIYPQPPQPKAEVSEGRDGVETEVEGDWESPDEDAMNGFLTQAVALQPQDSIAIHLQSEAEMRVEVESHGAKADESDTTSPPDTLPEEESERMDDIVSQFVSGDHHHSILVDSLPEEEPNTASPAGTLAEGEYEIINSILSQWVTGERDHSPSADSIAGEESDIMDSVLTQLVSGNCRRSVSTGSLAEEESERMDNILGQFVSGDHHHPAPAESLIEEESNATSPEGTLAEEESERMDSILSQFVSKDRHHPAPADSLTEEESNAASPEGTLAEEESERMDSIVSRFVSGDRRPESPVSKQPNLQYLRHKETRPLSPQTNHSLITPVGPYIAVVIPARQQRATKTSARIAMEKISLNDESNVDEDEDDSDEVNLVKY